MSKSAWSSDFKDAPKETPVLVRNPEWQCPAILKFTEEYGAFGEWVFCEEAIQNIDGSLIDTAGCEWALLPQ